MALEIKDLLNDLMEGLPADRQKAVTALTDEYGASETCKFLLAMVASATPRERRLTRMLLNQLEIVTAD